MVPCSQIREISPATPMVTFNMFKDINVLVVVKFIELMVTLMIGVSNGMLTMTLVLILPIHSLVLVL